MNISRDKLQKLTDIARLYYEQDKTQSEIAALYHVSRPLVSRMLREAKECGIVDIRIHAPLEGNSLVLNQARNIFGLQGGFVAPSAENDAVTNRTLAAGAIDYLRELGGNRFGIGWGTIIGELVSLLEQEQPEPSSLQSICPLVGNSGVSNRNYHSNENVRIFAWQSMAQPQYLYAPAFAENQQELDLIQRMESCQAVYTAWESLDLALVNIGNYPSTPDFASGARYGDLLSKRKAAGRLLAYYFDVHGDIIRSDTDYAIQIPTQLLGRCKNVVGICSANVKPRALAGALRTGLIHHLVASEELVRAASEYRGL